MIAPHVYNPTHEKLACTLSGEPDIEFAVLIGSQATGTAHSASDWDIALQWSPALEWLDMVGKTEYLRRKLAAAIMVAEDAIDLVDLHGANLTMRASVAEEGVCLVGDNSVAWARFLRRTWRDLEDFYWHKNHAA